MHSPLERAFDSDDRRAPGAPARLLVADDDEFTRQTVARYLRHRGYEVIEAEDGARALELGRRHAFDLALVDLSMPRVSGFEVIAELKAEHPHRPVMVLSALDLPDERVRAFDAGADDFVAKPVYMQELVRRIDSFERAHRAYRDLERANEQADHLRLFAAEAAALLAHDLNNGLSIGSANLQFLEEEVSRLTDDPEMLDAMAATRRALRRMVGLVGNFVDISRLEEAALVASRSPTDVGELLASVVPVHETRRSGEVREIEIDCAPNLVAEIDPMLTERVIHNLLNNATRYVDHGGRIAIQASIEIAGGKRQLVVRVGNTGVPVPAGLRENLFGKYRKGADGKAQRGMGLYFCRLACEAHGGSIALESSATFATCFVIRLALP